MSQILPVIGANDRCLADVLVSAFASVRAEDNPLRLPPSRRTIVVLVDGLGAVNLSARAAHARNIGSLNRRDVASGFPTTTASALTTLMTGRTPGETGMVGYTIRDPATGELLNQLSGLHTTDPTVWQPKPTLWEQHVDIPTAIISSPRYRESGLTKAILRGAPYVSAKSWDDRVAAVATFLSAYREGVVYVYIAELDMAAHASGVTSVQWIHRLEELDGFVADIQRLLAPADGLIITADHGVLDVPASKHLILSSGSPLLDGVTVGGEPRFLHLYTEDSIGALARWRESEGLRSHVVSRDEAIAAGWFGNVESFARDRIGDVLVTPRGDSVYYIDGLATPQSLAMVGQHGGISRSETLIPIISGGVFV